MTDQLSEQSAGAALHETQASYGRDLRGVVRALWNGSFSEGQAYDFFYATVRLGFSQAWADGSRSCGIEPADWTSEEKIELEQMTTNELGFILPFIDYIIAHNKVAGFKFGALLPRIQLWTNRYRDLVNRAKMISCSDRKLKWIRTAKDSCNSCIRLEGQVRRGSVWQKNDLRPQSPRLECMRSAGGATVCKCYFEETDESCSRGPLPRI